MEGHASFSNISSEGLTTNSVPSTVSPSPPTNTKAKSQTNFLHGQETLKLVGIFFLCLSLSYPFYTKFGKIEIFFFSLSLSLSLSLLLFIQSSVK